MVLFLCLLIVGLVLFSYLLIIAALVLLIIAAAAYLRMRITLLKKPKTEKNTAGRIIDHQD